MADSGQVGTFNSRVASEATSMNVIESPCAFATATVEPSGLTATLEGARPTGISRTEKSDVEITLTVPEAEDPLMGSVSIWEPLLGAGVSPLLGLRPPRLATKTSPAFWATATPNGAIPTGISRNSLRSFALITATVLFRSSATQ